jgi:hypothetical protein
VISSETLAIGEIMHPPEVLPASEVCDNDFNNFIRGLFHENRKYRRAHGSKKKYVKQRQQLGISSNIDALNSIIMTSEITSDADKQSLCDWLETVKEKLSHA